MKKRGSQSINPHISKGKITLVLSIILFSFFILYSNQEKQQIPTGEAARQIQESVTLEGIPEMVHGEKVDGTGLFNYYLLVGEKRYALQLAEKQKLHFPLAGMIRIQGILAKNPNGEKIIEASPVGMVDGSISVISMEEVFPSETFPTTSQPREKITGNTIIQSNAVLMGKNLRVAVIIFNFQNDQSQPWTPQQVYDVMFTKTGNTATTGSLKKYFEEASLGKFKVTGQVYGWYTVPYPNSPCVSQAWGYAAQQAAAAQGFDIHNYDIVVYILTSTSSCGGYAGWAGGAAKAAYINGYLHAGVTAHEVGHSIENGVGHANSLTCLDAGGDKTTINPTWETCNNTEYGDPFDVMGSTTWTYIRHFSTHLKDGLFFPRPLNTLEVTQSGAYTIKPLEQATTGITSIKILREIDSHNTSKFYYIDFRQPYGFDNFNAADPVVNGVTLRLGSDLLSQYYTSDRVTHLLDTTPTTSTFSDAPLVVGKTFIDPYKGISIKTLSISPAGAQVQITVPPPPTVCVRSKPGVMILPLSQYGNLGETLSYQVKVKNLNAAACGVSVFNIMVSMPPGILSVSPSSFQLSILPGEIRERTVQATRLPGAAPGNTYTFTVFAKNNTSSSYNSADGAFYATI